MNDHPPNASLEPGEVEERIRNRKVALVCGGGGVTGGIYEAGALHALDNFLIGRQVIDFDIFVGCSAGAIVAAAAAAGIRPQTMYRRLQSRGRVRGMARKLPPLRRRDLYQLRPTWYLEGLSRLPRVLRKSALELLNPFEEGGSADALSTLAELVPAGFLDNEGLGTWIRQSLLAVGAPTRFDELSKELYIPALNLDTGRRAIFGESGLGHVDIGQAVRASATVPFLYRPLVLEGQHYVDGGVERNLHLDVAVRHGAELIIAINPLVPLLNVPGVASMQLVGGRRSHVADLGPGYVLDQVFRVLVHTRMVALLERTRERNPDVEILLFEPRQTDRDMWDYNIMRYSAREKVARYAYEQTRETLESNLGDYRERLERFGMTTGELPPDAHSDQTMATRMARLERLAEVIDRTPFLRSILSRLPEGAEL